MGLTTGALDLSSADPILKELYHGQKVEDLTYRRNPTLGMLPKFEGFKGRNMPIPIQFGMPQGRSATFANAQAQVTPARFKEFLLTRVKDYSLAQIDGQTAEATAGADDGSFIEALTVEIDGAMKSLAASQSTAIFRNGTGSIGQVGSFTTNTLQLLNVPDVTCFEVGMTLVSNATDGGTPRAGSELIAGVNRTLGTLTSTSAAWNTVITGIAANDYLAISGDVNTKMSGFDAWIPLVAPTAGVLFYNVDRSVDSRLFGQLYDARNGDSMEESLINAQSQAAREGAGLDTVILNPIRMRDLQKGAQTKTYYQRTSGNAVSGNGENARISYSGIIVDGDEGPIKVFSDPRCQSSVGWGLTMDTWTLNTIGAAQKILMQDGLRIQRDPTSDSYSVRCGMYGNLSCNAPGFNIRIQYA